MSRRKSDITGVPTTSIYLREEDRITFRRMGGAAWLRQVLEARNYQGPSSRVARPATGVWTSVRLSPAHKAIYLEVGGADWLRGVLRDNTRRQAEIRLSNLREQRHART